MASSYCELIRDMRMVIMNILRNDDYHCDIWSLGSTCKQFYEDVALVFPDKNEFYRLIESHSRYSIHKDIERIERNDNMVTILKGVIAHQRYSLIQTSFKTILNYSFDLS